MQVLRLNGTYMVLLHRFEKGIILPNLWNVTPIHGKGYIFQSAQLEKGILLTDV